jgi:hypothetical protein
MLLVAVGHIFTASPKGGVATAFASFLLIHDSSFSSVVLPDLIVGHNLCVEDSPGSFRRSGHDPIAQQSKLVGSIVTGLIQLGIVQPIGSPIRVSTQRGLNFEEGPPV